MQGLRCSSAPHEPWWSQCCAPCRPDPWGMKENYSVKFLLGRLALPDGLPINAAVAREPVLCGEVAEQTVAELQTALGLPTLGAVGPQVCRAEETRAVGQVPRTQLAPLLDSQTESAQELPEGSAEPMCQQSSFADTMHLFYLLNQIFFVRYWQINCPCLQCPSTNRLINHSRTKPSKTVIIQAQHINTFAYRMVILEESNFFQASCRWKGQLSVQ